MIDILKKAGAAGGLTGAFSGSRLSCTGPSIQSVSPVNGEAIGEVAGAGPEQVETVIAKAVEAFAAWRRTPAPKRGEVVRQIGHLNGFRRCVG